MLKSCKAAVEESGLSTSQFAIKYFGAKAGTPNASPQTEHNTAGIEAAIKECLNDWRAFAEQSSAACARALAASGLPAEEFWKKFEEWAVQHPTETEPSKDVDALVKECFAKYTANDPTTLESCKKAMAASGLNGDAFWDKYGRPFNPSTDTKPTARPSATRPATAEFEHLVYTCRKLQGAIVDASPNEQVNAASATCDKAIAASGLSASDFWNRWPPFKPTTKPTATTKPEPTAKPVTTAEAAELAAKCLQLYANVKISGDTKTVSEACGAAIRASGMSSADFWAKYHPTAN